MVTQKRKESIGFRILLCLGIVITLLLMHVDPWDFVPASKVPFPDPIKLTADEIAELREDYRWMDPSERSKYTWGGEFYIHHQLHRTPIQKLSLRDRTFFDDGGLELFIKRGIFYVPIVAVTMYVGIGSLHFLFLGERKESYFLSFFYDLLALPLRILRWSFAKAVHILLWSFASANSSKNDSVSGPGILKSGRIEKARFDVQLVYDRHASSIAKEFPEKKLQDYFEKYMNDSIDVETVEQRGRDLQDMILGLAKPTENKKKEITPETIRAHYDRQRRQLEALDLEPDAHEGQLAELNYQEDQALSDHFRNA